MTSDDRERVRALEREVPKHLDRYVHEFAGKHNIRESGTLAQMRDTVARRVGRNLLYRDLVADNGLASRGAVVAAPRGGTARGPASPGSRPPDRGPDQASVSFSSLPSV